MITIRVRTLSFSCLLAAAVAFPGFAQQPAQTNQAQNQSNKQLTANERSFLKMAAMDNMTEIQMGKLAQTKSQDNKIQQYGQTLINDHQNAQDELKTLAQQYNVALPTQLDQTHQQEVNRMGNLSGAGFDRAFVQRAVTDHQKAVQQFQKMSQNATNSDVRQFASNTASVLEKHLDEAQNLEENAKQASNMPPDQQRQKTTQQSTSSTRTQNQETDQTARGPHTLPKTAGDGPILLLIGMFALSAGAGLRLRRTEK